MLASITLLAGQRCCSADSLFMLESPCRHKKQKRQPTNQSVDCPFLSFDYFVIGISDSHNLNVNAATVWAVKFREDDILPLTKLETAINNRNGER